MHPQFQGLKHPGPPVPQEGSSPSIFKHAVSGIPEAAAPSSEESSPNMGRTWGFPEGVKAERQQASAAITPKPVGRPDAGLGVI